MKILLEDKDQIVVHKPAGLATQTARLGEKDLVSEIKNHISKEQGNPSPYLSVINRLDQPVEGIVLFAKNSKAAAALSAQMQNGVMQKYYYAAVYGHMEQPKDELTDYLEKDSRSNCSRVVLKKTPAAKKAQLAYEVISEETGMDIVKIHLLTGRHHQIRVQFSSRKHPLIGDTKYGSEESIMLGKEAGVRTPALCACCLVWEHPVSKKALKVQIKPEHPLLNKIEE